MVDNLSSIPQKSGVPEVTSEKMKGCVVGIVRPAINVLALITLSFPNMVSAANICWVDQVIASR